jgi:hypothetical protein
VQSYSCYLAPTTGNSAHFQENDVFKKKNIPTNLDYAKFRRDFGGYKH